MAQYLADLALLPTGMARDVAMTVDARGMLAAVRPEAPDTAGATRLPGLTLPGLPNVHGHAFQRAMAGLAERRERADDSFWSWRTRMYELVQALTPDDVHAIAAQAYAEMLQAGYTHAVEFHYLHNAPDGAAYADPLAMADHILAARAEAGIGLTLLPTLYRFGGFGEQPPEPAQQRFVTAPDAFYDRLATLAQRHRDTATVDIGAALHSLRAVGLDDVAAAADRTAAIDPAMPIHIHAAEQTAEVASCQAAHGARPVELLLDTADPDARWCVIHATHMDAQETGRLAQSGAVAGLCPTTEANLGDGVFALADYRKHGGRFAVGSDSHVAIDPRAELALLEYQARLAGHTRNIHATEAMPHTGVALYQAALAGGAQATGAPVGALEAGRRADLVVLDTAHPNLAAAHDGHLVDAWLFARHGSPVRDVAVAGQWVVRAGRHVAAETIAERYRRVVRARMT